MGLIRREAAIDALEREQSLVEKPITETRWFDLGLRKAQDILSELPPAPQWIPCSERLPKELKPVNITWVNRMPESYYKDIKDKPFTATGVYFCEQWYWWSTLCTDMLSEYGRNHCDRVDEHIEIIAWMELPEPYKEEE